MNFIFNEDPDRISKNLVLCSLHFTADSFKKQGPIQCGIFRKIETKRRCCATILDPTVMSQHTSVTVFITSSLLLCLLNRSFDMSIYAFLT